MAEGLGGRRLRKGKEGKEGKMRKRVVCKSEIFPTEYFSVPEDIQLETLQRCQSLGTTSNVYFYTWQRNG